MARLETGPLLYVEWQDHAGDNGWTDESEINTRPSLCRTVGWLFHEDRQALTLVSSHAEYPESTALPQGMSTLTLVKSCITRRVRLKDPSA